MYSKQPKKMLIMYILDILQRYTDENHRLSQKKIADILENEYDMKVDRKAVRRNLLNLIESGYDIEYSETIRNVPVRDNLLKIELLYYSGRLLHTECESSEKEFYNREVCFLKYSAATNVNDAWRAERLPRHQCFGLFSS